MSPPLTDTQTHKHTHTHTHTQIERERKRAKGHKKTNTHENSTQNPMWLWKRQTDSAIRYPINSLSPSRSWGGHRGGGGGGGVSPRVGDGAAMASVASW